MCFIIQESHGKCNRCKQDFLEIVNFTKNIKTISSIVFYNDNRNKIYERRNLYSISLYRAEYGNSDIRPKGTLSLIHI